VVAAILVVFLLQRQHWLELPMAIIFGLILALIFFVNVHWWAWVDARLTAHKNPGILTGRGRKWLRPIWMVYILFVFLPLWLVLIGGQHLWDACPVPVIIWVLSWHMLMVWLVGIGALLAVLWWAGRLLARIKIQKAAADNEPVDISRRVFLIRSAMAAPLVVAGVSMLSGLKQAGRFQVRKLQMKLPRLLERLRGLTITHISDLHVGRLFRPEHLPAVVEAANQLKSDVVAVTGDIIDHSNDFLPAAAEAIGQLEHRYGRFVVLGNHDLIDAPRELIDYLRDREPGLLMDSHRPLTIGGEQIQVAGLFWSRYDEARGQDPGHLFRASSTLANADPERFTLGLAHHPHAFDFLATWGVDLTLSGHTHGGQLMMPVPGMERPLGAGNLMFRYVWGQYRIGNSALYVNSGVGNWFPVRLHAPAEIVQIQLV